MRLSFLRTPFLRTPGTPNRKIFRAAVVVGVLTLVVKLGAMVKELVVAGKFGRGDALDAFLIAYLVPSFLVVLLSGAFAAAVVPVFVEVRQKRGAEPADILFSSLMMVNIAALTTIAAILAFSSPLFLRFIASGFSPEKLRLTQHLLYAVLPFLVFSGFSSCATAALNAMETFALPAATPLITSIATMVLLVFGPASWGPLLLVGGVVAGSILEAILLGRAIFARGVHLRLRWSGFTPEMRRVLSQYIPMLGGIFLMSGTNVVDQSMAAMLAPGSVAALGYAAKIVSAAVGIGATALSTASFPYFSRMVAQGDWKGCWHTLKRYCTLIAATTFPLMIGLILFSKPLVRLLYQRGAFTSADTNLVSRVQICYSLQLPFYVGGALLSRFLSSARRNYLLLYISGVNLGIDVILNLVLMKVLGVAGIALSTSIVYIIAFSSLAVCTIRLLMRQVQAGRKADEPLHQARSY